MGAASNGHMSLRLGWGRRLRQPARLPRRACPIRHFGSIAWMLERDDIIRVPLECEPMSH